MEGSALKKVVLTAVTALSFAGLFGISNANVQASSWHYGTPVVLRGRYSAKHKSYPQFEDISISANKMVYGSQGMPNLTLSRTIYKKSGSNYLIHGWAHSNGGTPGYDTWKLVKRGYKLGVKFPGGQFDWLHK